MSFHGTLIRTAGDAELRGSTWHRSVAFDGHTHLTECGKTFNAKGQVVACVVEADREDFDPERVCNCVIGPKEVPTA